MATPSARALALEDKMDVDPQSSETHPTTSSPAETLGPPAQNYGKRPPSSTQRGGDFEPYGGGSAAGAEPRNKADAQAQENLANLRGTEPQNLSLKLALCVR